MYKLNLEIKCQQLVVTLYQMSLLFEQLGCEKNRNFADADAFLASLAKSDLEKQNHLKCVLGFRFSSVVLNCESVS